MGVSEVKLCTQLLLLILTLCTLCGLCSCKSAEQQAREDVQRQMTQRSVAVDRSMKIYAHAREAQLQGQRKHALELYRQAVEVYPENIYALTSLGELELEGENY